MTIWHWLGVLAVMGVQVMLDRYKKRQWPFR